MSQPKKRLPYIAVEMPEKLKKAIKKHVGKNGNVSKFMREAAAQAAGIDPELANVPTGRPKKNDK